MVPHSKAWETNNSADQRNGRGRDRRFVLPAAAERLVDDVDIGGDGALALDERILHGKSTCWALNLFQSSVEADDQGHAEPG